jgi:hypothetical protein
MDLFTDICEDQSQIDEEKKQLKFNLIETGVCL